MACQRLTPPKADIKYMIMIAHCTSVTSTLDRKDERYRRIRLKEGNATKQHTSNLKPQSVTSAHTLVIPRMATTHWPSVPLSSVGQRVVALLCMTRADADLMDWGCISARDWK